LAADFDAPTPRPRLIESQIVVSLRPDRAVSALNWTGDAEAHTRRPNRVKLARSGSRPPNDGDRCSFDAVTFNRTIHLSNTVANYLAESRSPRARSDIFNIRKDFRNK